MTNPALIYSSDGVNWSACTSTLDSGPDIGTIYGVATYGGMWVAVGYRYSTYSAVILYSSDGITWLEAVNNLNANGIFKGVTFGAGVFVAYGSKVGVGPYIETSPDGIVWTAQSAWTSSPIYGIGFNCITYTFPQFLIVLSDNVGAFTWISILGTSGWTVQDYFLTDAGVVPQAAVVGGGKYIALTGKDPDTVTISSSPTGVAFNNYPQTAVPPSFGGASYGNGLWGVAYNDTVGYSTDGETYGFLTPTPFSGGGKVINGLSFLDTNHYAFGQYLNGSAAIMARSADLVSWTTTTIPINSPLLVAGTFGGSTYVAGGAAIPADPPPPGENAVMSLDNVVVQSTLTESPCTAVQFGTQPTGAPNAGLRWSDTRGETWGAAVPQEISTNPYTQMQWNRTGIARDRVFELFWSGATKTALNGAFIEVAPLGS